jgi:hypothetical protein
MTPPTLHDALREVADRAPQPDLAERAVRLAERRRRRRLVAVPAAVVACLLVLVVAASGVGLQLPAPLQPASGSERAETLPERVGEQWFVRDLPRRTGPISMVVGWGSSSDWFAVGQDGQRWRIPNGASAYAHDVFPTLSPDGRLIARPLSAYGPYVVDDQVSGERLVEIDATSGLALPSARTGEVPAWSLADQEPGVWSPDGRLLLAPVRERSDDARLALIDVSSGSVTPLDLPGPPAGFVSDRTIAVVDPQELADPAAPQPLVATDRIPLRLVDVDDGAVRTVDLLPGEPMEALELTQHSASVSPDGSRIAIVGGPWGNESLWTFSIADGQQIGRSAPLPDGISCRPSGWVDERTVAMTARTSGALVIEGIDITDASRRRLSVVNPRLGASCAEVAALPTPWETRGGLLLGTSTAGWTWWWREIALGSAAALLLVALVARRSAVRRARRALAVRAARRQPPGDVVDGTAPR